jgi:ketosteroid isomerase-like protein
MQADEATPELLDAFAEAFNRHDVQAILSMMTDDPVFEASAGPEIKGQVAVGPAAVGRAFQEVFDTFPNARWSDAKHFIVGNRAVTEWVFSGTRKDGTRVEVQGCDVFTLRQGKIAVKNSYRKQRTSGGPGARRD